MHLALLVFSAIVWLFREYTAAKKRRSKLSVSPIESKQQNRVPSDTVAAPAFGQPPSTTPQTVVPRKKVVAAPATILTQSAYNDAQARPISVPPALQGATDTPRGKLLMDGNLLNAIILAEALSEPRCRARRTNKLRLNCPEFIADSPL